MKIVISFLITLTTLALNAQNYQISFTGTGQSSTVDSVKIVNLTSEFSLTIPGTDTLHLTGPLLGLFQIQESNNLLVYPNPVSENAYIEFSQQNNALIYMKLYDVLGKLVLEKSLKLTAGKHYFKLNGLNKGSYVLSIASCNKMFTTKIISLGTTSNNVPLISLTSGTYIPHNKLKTDKSKTLQQMLYNDGEILMLTAFSGDFSTVSTLVPSGDAVVNNEFIACSDNNGNNYGVVTIGSQIWMAENLKTTQFNDGTPIDYWDSGAWSTTLPAFCWFNANPFAGDSLGYINTYGLLYNWYTVDSASNGNKNICPVGWHIPSDAEWLNLQNYLGGTTFSGSKLKETGNNHWVLPNNDATNETGFTALPTGYRLWNGTFLNVGYYSYWWSKTPDISNPNFAWYFGCYYDNASFDGSSYDKKSAYSIRCIKD